ncbi:MAG: ABC transporter permease [Vampirovibrionales bacterium]|nr:ABC transporter permease [Vampirovibrionales bacterium]
MTPVIHAHAQSAPHAPSGLISRVMTWAQAQFSLGGIFSICWKELVQLSRDPYLVAFIIILPLIQLMITGLAIQREINEVPTLVVNYDRRNASIELIKALEASQMFAIDQTVQPRSEEDLGKAIRKGQYRVGIIIPPDYSEKALSSGQSSSGPPEINLMLDGTSAAVSKAILGAGQAVLSNYSQELATDNLPQGILPPMPIKLNAKVINNSDLSTSLFLIPGILAIILHMMTVLFTSFSIVREREAGTLEQLMVSPLRVGDLMVGKVLPYCIIGFIDMLLTLGVMLWFFDIPVNGSLWFLLVSSIVFIFTSLGVGLFISTSCRSQVQAIQLSVGLLLPSLLLSGFVFPIEPMPLMIKVISYALPLTYYLDIIRGVMIKGLGATDLWGHTLILVGMSLLLMGFSIARFSKRLA